MASHLHDLQSSASCEKLPKSVSSVPPLLSVELESHPSDPSSIKLHEPKLVHQYQGVEKLALTDHCSTHHAHVSYLHGGGHSLHDDAYYDHAHACREGQEHTGNMHSSQVHEQSHHGYAIQLYDHIDHAAHHLGQECINEHNCYHDDSEHAPKQQGQLDSAHRQGHIPGDIHAYQCNQNRIHGHAHCKCVHFQGPALEDEQNVYQVLDYAQAGHHHEHRQDRQSEQAHNRHGQIYGQDDGHGHNHVIDSSCTLPARNLDLLVSPEVVDLDMRRLGMHTGDPPPLLDISYNDCRFPVEESLASCETGDGPVSQTQCAIKTDDNPHHDHQNEQPPQQAYGSLAINNTLLHEKLASTCGVRTNCPELKRPKPAIENTKGINIYDVGDAVEDKMGDGKATASRNFICTSRAKRIKLNEKLFSLASIGTRRSKELQPQVKDEQKDFPTYRVSEFNVFNLDETFYHFDLRCEKGTGLMVQLTKALEALNLDIINANLAAVGDQVINSVVIKVDRGEMLKPKEIEERIMEVADKFGFLLF